MTAEQLHVLQNALGVNQYGQGAMSRNYFAVGALDEIVCRELVDLGFMREFPPADCRPYPYLAVTAEGIHAMRRESPVPSNVSPVRKRYLEYCQFADAYSCTFAEWLKIRTTDAYRDMKVQA
jgi:hypothetical protein